MYVQLSCNKHGNITRLFTRLSEKIRSQNHDITRMLQEYNSSNNNCCHNCVRESLDNEQIVIIDFYTYNDQLDNVLKEANLPGNILWSTTFNSAYFTLSILRHLELFIPAPGKVLHVFSRVFGGHEHPVKIDSILAFFTPTLSKNNNPSLTTLSIAYWL